MQLFTSPQPEVNLKPRKMRLPETVLIEFSRGSSEVFVNFTKKTRYCRRTGLPKTILKRILKRVVLNVASSVIFAPFNGKTE